MSEPKEYTKIITLKEPGEAGIARGSRHKREHSWLKGPKKIFVWYPADGFLILGSPEPNGGNNIILLLSPTDAARVAVAILEGANLFLPEDATPPLAKEI